MAGVINNVPLSAPTGAVLKNVLNVVPFNYLLDAFLLRGKEHNTTNFDHQNRKTLVENSVLALEGIPNANSVKVYYQSRRNKQIPSNS